MKRIFTLLYALGFSIHVIAQTGPGGVGTATTNTLWLQGDDIAQADGTAIASWSDRSGNGNDASQSTGGYQPTYETGELNGHSVVRFDGIDDYFDDARSYNARTVLIVYNILSANQATTDLGQIWGNYAEGCHVSLDARGGGGTWSFDANGSVSNQGRLGLNGAAYPGGYAGNPGSPNWTYDQFDLVASEFNATRSITRQVIGSLVPSFAVGVHQYGGDVAEILVYNTVLNNAQRIIVENYLAARYGLSILNDFYAYQGLFPYEVAGIGRESAGNDHTSAMSADLLRIENATSLNDGDYLLFGHDNTDISTWTTTESPDGGTNIHRFTREWRLNETGDVGNVDFVIDAASFPAQPAGHTMYALLVDADGDFSSGASVYEMVNTSGSEYSTIGIDVNNGEYVTIASIRPVVDHSLSASSGDEPTNASIDVELNFIPQTDVTADYTTADGTAQVAQPDYTGATPGTLTITAPASSGSYTIAITNDVVLESDETFTVTLSNPSVGIIGSNSVHTYTIHDDDNPRKVYFDLASSSGSEATSPGSISVSINLVDGSNPTTVDYAITGGTASGGGTDYTLASGTLNIPSGSTTGNIPFTVNDDGIFENNETFIMTLSNPTNCNLDLVMPFGGTGFTDHTYTINDNDTAPVVQFNSTSGSGSEGTSPANFQVDLSATSGADVLVDYAVTGTATGGGTDYTLADGTLTIITGSTNDNISAIIVDDASVELAETIIVTLSNPTGATLGVNTVFTYTINDNDVTGFTGPGGVGESSNLQLWLRADDIAQADMTAVTSWSDQSGNSHDASQGTPGNQPTYRTGILNGHASVRFDGTGDHLTGSHSYEARTVLAAYQMLSAIQNTGDLAQVWGSYSEGVQVGLDARSGGGNWSFDGGGSASARHAIDGATYTASFSTNPTTPKWTYDAGQLLAVEFNSNYSVTRYDIGSLINPVGHFLGADVTEIIVYDFSVNDAQRNIVENYLAAKYGITITNDLYAAESTHGFEVAGIGRETSSAFHIDAQGSGVVRINDASSLDDGDYLLWGHDNGNLNSSGITDLPATIYSRLARDWTATETGEVGTITIKFDLSTVPGSITTDELRLLIDDDGTYSSGSTDMGPPSSLGSGIYEWTGVTLDDGDHFTIGSTSSSTPLPIELMGFDAILLENNSVRLDWQTATETNNDYFSIERSKNGSYWEKVIDIESKDGNSSSLLSYSAIDSNPITGFSYYRLKQTDFDGQYSYSKMRSITVENLEIGEIKIYPNPVEDLVSIVGNISNLKIYNALGQNVTKLTKQISVSDSEMVIDLRLPAGIYVIRTNTAVHRVYKK